MADRPGRIDHIPSDVACADEPPAPVNQAMLMLVSRAGLPDVAPDSERPAAGAATGAEGGRVRLREHAIGTASWRVRDGAVVSAYATTTIARAVVLVEELDAQTCAAYVGSETPEDLAMWLGLLGADFVVDGPPEMAAAFVTMNRRYARAARSVVRAAV